MENSVNVVAAGSNPSTPSPTPAGSTDAPGYQVLMTFPPCSLDGFCRVSAATYSSCNKRQFPSQTWKQQGTPGRNGAPGAKA